ncbi:MAG TPA: RNA polymerase sigma factor SigJ [Luteitalea sp.]|nr:RNA polymerase sigma factor SigJ [Luteitalea sp.]
MVRRLSQLRPRLVFEAEDHPHVTELDATLATFESLRGRLFGLAYRMLGSRADAEDVVQDAYLRWHQADRAAIRTPEAWLVTTTTRLAIDRLRALRTVRDAYVGPWLPEPLVGQAGHAPDHAATLASDLSMAFLLVLERLAPEERAAFLLHDVFETGYADIARMLGKTEAACRQIVTRARQRVRGDRQRFEASHEARAKLTESFAAAMAARDETALLQLFTPDAVWMSDGGGVVHAAPRPLVGIDRVVRVVMGLQRLLTQRGRTVEPATVNGEPGLVLRDGERLVATYAFDIDGDRISAVYVVLNPAKLPVG